MYTSFIVRNWTNKREREKKRGNNNRIALANRTFASQQHNYEGLINSIIAREKERKKQYTRVIELFSKFGFKEMINSVCVL